MKLLFRYWVIALLGYSVIGLAGCATVTEVAKGIAGTSTKVLEEGRKDAIKKTFNYDFDTCYQQSKEILSRSNNYIYAQDLKIGMIAIYLSSEDTTPVGLFLTSLGKNSTQVEVSSPSKYAKELIAKKLFSKLEEPDDAKQSPKAP